MPSITDYLEIILNGGNLNFDQAKNLLDRVFDGGIADVQVAAFLAAMRMKQATADEIAGLASSLRDHAVKVKVDVPNLIDTCGTGGATVKMFNISTGAALVAAGAGAYVAKHGNRAITSSCGSADVLAELGVNINASPGCIAKCIEQAHIGFMFAPNFHPAMKFVQPIRKSLDFRTAFNILGPLANPAGVTAQVMGVCDVNLLEKITKSLDILGTKNAMVIHSDGLDELSTIAPSTVCRLNNSKILTQTIDPASLGFKCPSIEALQGSTSAANAAIITNIIERNEDGACKDIVILNAAAAIIVAGLAEDFPAAVELAKESLDSGNALGCLNKLIDISNA
jgi:anthranilate phosphoribosyltransferase